MTPTPMTQFTSHWGTHVYMNLIQLKESASFTTPLVLTMDTESILKAENWEPRDKSCVQIFVNVSIH